MQNLDIEGSFWIEDSPEDSVPGRLTFDPMSGAELELLGDFAKTRQNSLSFDDRPAFRIFGVASGKIVTLLDCLESFAGGTYPGITKQRFSPSTVLTGAHITSGHLLAFDSVSLQFNHLLNWVGKSGIKVNERIYLGSVDDGFQFTYEPLNVETFESETGKLSMAVRPTSNMSINSIELRETAYLAVEFDEPKALDDIAKISTSLKDLLTIGVHSPGLIIGATLTHTDFLREFGGGKQQNVPIEVYSQGYVEEKPRDIHRFNMLFDYSAIGGVQGIARWLEMSSTYRSVVNSLLSHIYLPGLYEENRFSNIVIAAEGFAKKQFSQEGNPSLKANLEKLVIHVGDSFAPPANMSAWAKEVASFRNRLLHGDSVEGDDFDRIYWLGHSVYLLVVLSLLKECGVNSSVLNSISEFQIFRRATKALQPSVH